MKNIQISEELFVRLCGYHLLDHRDAEQEAIIQHLLQDKLDKINKRDEYAKRIQREENK